MCSEGHTWKRAIKGMSLDEHIKSILPLVFDGVLCIDIIFLLKLCYL
jgi:hypothetical protein